MDIDPKVVIANAAAQQQLSSKMAAANDKLKQVIRHRGHAILMLKSGKIVEGTIKLATVNVMVVDEGHHPLTRIDVPDIVDADY